MYNLYLYGITNSFFGNQRVKWIKPFYPSTLMVDSDLLPMDSQQNPPMRHLKHSCMLSGTKLNAQLLSALHLLLCPRTAGEYSHWVTRSVKPHV